MSDLAAALSVAIRCHAGQLDKQGEPYLLHVLRVVEAVSDEAKVVAALHDVCEDSDIGPMEVRRACGLDRREFGALCNLTREGESYVEYIDMIARCPLAREVKLADLKDHMYNMPAGDDWESLRRRYEKAIGVLESA
jgi:hypothetical protein